MRRLTGQVSTPLNVRLEAPGTSDVVGQYAMSDLLHKSCEAPIIPQSVNHCVRAGLLETCMDEHRAQVECEALYLREINGCWAMHNTQISLAHLLADLPPLCARHLHGAM